MRYLFRITLPRITLLVYFSLTGLTGCDNTDDPANNNEGIAIPVAIATAALPAGSTLVANLYVDKELTSEPLATKTIVNGQNTVNFVDIPVTPGIRTFTLEFTYTPIDKPSIILASAVSLPEDLAPGSSTPVDFIEDNYTYPDDDEDNIDNLTEIENGSDPNNPANIPPRVSGDLISLYDFQKGDDSSEVLDVSKVGAPLNLTIEDVTKTIWLDRGGLSIIAGPDLANPGTLLSSGSPATKIMNAVKESDELTVEFWAKPANTSQGGTEATLARVVTISKDTRNRNMTAAQSGSQYAFRLRSSVTNRNGTFIKEKETDASAVVRSRLGTATKNLTHVVMTHKDGMRSVYINNELSNELLVGGKLFVDGDPANSWDEGYKLALANEFVNSNGDQNPRPWLGELYLVAIYSRALSAEEINLNYIVGFNKTAPQPEMAEN